MLPVNNLTYEEKQVVSSIENYFRSNNMTTRDKLFNAMLIAQHDLETHNFCTEHERLKIARFKEVLDQLLLKVNGYNNL